MHTGARSNAQEMVATTTGGFGSSIDRSRHGVPNPQRCVRPPASMGRPHRRNAPGSTPDPRTEIAHEQIIIEHQPHRPDWLCTGCAEPWPCPTARQHLKADVQPTQLAIMMTSWMTEAAGELPRATPGELWDRFVAWTRRPPAVSGRDRPE